MRRALRLDEKAISPVIATIIIVAVAIVMSIAVAYWMMGLATTFTRYEKLEYTTAYVVPNQTHWNVTFTLKNTGTAVATISNILINGVPYTTISGVSLYNCSDTDVVSLTLPVSVSIGGNITMILSIGKNTQFQVGVLTPGSSVEITITTAAGNQYPKTLVLP